MISKNKLTNEKGSETPVSPHNHAYEDRIAKGQANLQKTLENETFPAKSDSKFQKAEAIRAVRLIVEELRDVDDSLCNKIGDYFKLGTQDDNDCERAHAFIQEAIDKLSRLRFDDIVSP